MKKLIFKMNKKEYLLMSKEVSYMSDRKRFEKEISKIGVIEQGVKNRKYGGWSAGYEILYYLVPVNKIGKFTDIYSEYS